MYTALYKIACLQILAPQASRQASVSSFTPGRPSNSFKPDFTIHLVSAACTAGCGQLLTMHFDLVALEIWPDCLQIHAAMKTAAMKTAAVNTAAATAAAVLHLAARQHGLALPPDLPHAEACHACSPRRRMQPRLPSRRTPTATGPCRPAGRSSLTLPTQKTQK